MKSDNNNQIKAFIAIFAAGIFGATQGVFVKIAVKEIPPFSFTFIRFLLASLIMLPFVFRKIKFDKHLLKISLISLLGTANVILFAFGVRLTTVNMGAILYTGVPIVTALLSFLILREKLRFNKLLGIVLGFSGAIFVVILPSLQKIAIQGNLLGNILILIGVLAFSCYSILSKKEQKYFSPFVLTGILMTTSTVVSGAFLPIDLKTNPNWWKLITITGLTSTLIVVASTIFFYFLYQYAIKQGGALVASMSLYLQPVTAVILAWFLLGEFITIPFVLGGVLVFTGAWLVSGNR